MTNEVYEKSVASIEKRIDEIRSSDKPKTKANQAEIKRLQSTLNKIHMN